MITNHQFLVLARGRAICNRLSQKTGTCSPKPSPRKSDRRHLVWSCAENAKDAEEEGNNIQYFINNKGTKLSIEMVDAEYCNPKPKECGCSTMLKSLLDKTPNVQHIEGYFVAKPFIKVCRCYLGAAARKGFDTVEFTSESSKDECNAKLEFNNKEPIEGNDKHYANFCKNYENLKCGRAHGIITKS